LQEVLASAVGSLIQVADLLAPFMPHAGKTIREIFVSGVIKPFEGVLFPRIYNHTPDPKAGKSFADKPVKK
jgi:hypothetical protein